MPDENNVQPEAQPEAPVVDEAALENPPPVVPQSVPSHPVAALIDAYGKSTSPPRAAYSVLGYYPDKNVIIIKDEHADGSDRRSVTNDAEQVVGTINTIHHGVRIIYQDTCGDYAEIYHDRGSFRGYQPIQRLDAYIKAMY